MATTTLIPVEQYLATRYRPDCDYVDGELQERNVGEHTHNLVQMMISNIFLQHRHEWKLWAIAEQRIQVLPTRFRIPDVCVIRPDQPFHEVLPYPPLLCVEILSQEDRFGRVLAKIEDYLAFGVPHIWIVDPRTREVWEVGADGKPILFTGTELTIEGTPAQVSVVEMFSLLDEVKRESHE